MNIIKTSCEFSKYSIEDICNFLLTEVLKIDGIELTIVENPKLLQRFSNDRLRMQALLVTTLLPHVYILYVYENFNDPVILCHELIHLQQYEKGELTISQDYRELTWKDIKYTSSVPYEERPWEAEAFREQNNLWIKYKRAHRRCKLLEL